MSVKQLTATDYSLPVIRMGIDMDMLTPFGMGEEIYDGENNISAQFGTPFASGMCKYDDEPHETHPKVHLNPRTYFYKPYSKPIKYSVNNLKKVSKLCLKCLEPFDPSTDYDTYDNSKEFSSKNGERSSEIVEHFPSDTETSTTIDPKPDSIIVSISLCKINVEHLRRKPRTESQWVTVGLRSEV